MPGASEVVAEDPVVVYFEMEPGNGVGTHTDSEEELLLVIEGHVSVTIDDDEGDLAADETAVVPRKSPHSVRNVGNETAAVIGFFPKGEVHHAFDQPVMPYGTREFVPKHEPESAE